MVECRVLRVFVAGCGGRGLFGFLRPDYIMYSSCSVGLYMHNAYMDIQSTQSSMWWYVGTTVRYLDERNEHMYVCTECSALRTEHADIHMVSKN